MAAYSLYYWPIPFRGQFVRAVLAHAGASWEEAGPPLVAATRAAPPEEQPVPHMGPPVLTETATGQSVSQMPAILMWLGERHGLLPDTAHGRAMALKVILDANDVLSDITRANGAQMWTPADWADFLPRLHRWMALFEVTGTRHGLTPDAGTLLGTGAPGLADLSTATLWGTICARFPVLRPALDTHAPGVAALTDRIRALPEQAALIAESDAAWGDAWCGGQIEASLRRVLDP